MKPVVVWFRRDLRVDDHAALYHASKTGAPLIPLFIVDAPLIRRLPSDGAVFDFQAECLHELGQSVRKLGGTLVLREGNPAQVHKEIIRTFKPAALFFNRDYEPYAVERDHEVSNIYAAAGASVHSYKDHVLQEPNEVLTADDRPYVVFTPYSRTWKKLEPMQPFGMPARFSTPTKKSGPIPTAAVLKKPKRIPHSLFAGGEREARKRWKKFLASGIDTYDSARNHPALDGTSGLSPYLRFGCISVRTLYRDIVGVVRRSGSTSAGKFLDELIWREFYQSVLFHFPRLLTSNYRQEFDSMQWRRSDKHLQAWKEGRTGFPLVDAGMRQLNETGWMHNRVRMVVASFLTKDLRQNWKTGERYFEEKLIDIETASNNGGWQWSAGTGVDPKPLRIFNPRLQSERYDPDGAYIRKFVPELKNVPAKFIHAPHEMPPALQKEAGCVIGKHYPAPIVDHAAASAEYRRYYAAVKQKGPASREDGPQKVRARIG